MTTASKNPAPAPEPNPPLPPAAEADAPDMLPGPPLVGSKYKYLQLTKQSLWTHTETCGLNQPLNNGQNQSGTCIDITCIAPGVYRATAGIFTGDDRNSSIYTPGSAAHKAGKKPSSVFFVDFCSGVESAALLDTQQKTHEAPKTDPKVAQLLSTVSALSPEQRTALRDAIGSGEPNGKAA